MPEETRRAPRIRPCRSEPPADTTHRVALGQRSVNQIPPRARQWCVAAIWVADSEPNPRFTLYTRGNVGEVFPHVMTALTGTLIGDAVRQGQVEVFVEMGVLRRHEVRGPSVGTGVFG